jgi:hypothetical protein
MAHAAWRMWVRVRAHGFVSYMPLPPLGAGVCYLQLTIKKHQQEMLDITSVHRRLSPMFSKHPQAGHWGHLGTWGSLGPILALARQLELKPELQIPVRAFKWVATRTVLLVVVRVEEWVVRVPGSVRACKCVCMRVFVRTCVFFV